MTHSLLPTGVSRPSRARPSSGESCSCSRKARASSTVLCVDQADRRRRGRRRRLRQGRRYAARAARHEARHGDAIIGRGDPVGVAEIQGRAVEAAGLAGLLVGAETDRRIDIEIEGQLERQALADAQRIDRRPRIGMGQLQRAVFGRQRIGGQPEVHAIGIGAQPATRIVGHRGPGLGRAAAQAEVARLHVGGELRDADQFGQRAADRAPGQVHLEEAVAGMRVALQEGGVVVIGRIDGRNALGIPGDPGRCAESRCTE